jgi:hypothetical protein
MVVISNIPTIAFIVWHGLKIIIQFTGSNKKATDAFCEILKKRLQKHVALMKKVKLFVPGCVSEDLIHNREPTMGGLGLSFGYIENRKSNKEKQKIKYWISYLNGTCSVKLIGRLWKESNSHSSTCIHQTREDRSPEFSAGRDMGSLLWIHIQAIHEPGILRAASFGQCW